jgi:hypothetical protein
LAILPLFFSCGTLSPVSGLREKPPLQAKNIEEAFPLWEPLSGGVLGLDFYAGRILEPKLEFWAVRADLAKSNLRIIVSKSELSSYVTTFTEDYGCIAGINANPFDPVSDKEGEKRATVGIAVSDGILISRPVSKYDALYFYKSGTAAIAGQGGIGDVSQIENAVGGFYIVLENGRLSERLLEQGAIRQDMPRHPRSAAGLCREGKILYLLVVDGRRPGSVGATEAELGLLLKQLGCFNGLNLDGGASSVLALRYSDGKVRAVNTPIHNRIPGNQRGVAACLGIALNER